MREVKKSNVNTIVKIGYDYNFKGLSIQRITERQLLQMLENNT